MSMRLDILSVIRAGRVWSGRIRGRIVEMWLHGGRVQVWLPVRNGGTSYGAATVTEALREL